MILYLLKNRNDKVLKLKKKAGNTLVEVVAAISIILVAGDILFSSVMYANKCKEVSIENEEANRIIHSIQNEIKYNYKIEEIINLLNDRPLKLKKENILKELRNKKLDNIESGEDIIITIENKSRMEINFKIKYNLNSLEGKSIERVYKKSEWMEKK